MEKFVKIDWPESQDYIGNKECYLAAGESADDRFFSPTYFVPEDLYVEAKSNNKTLAEIETTYEQYQYLETMVRESMRRYLSRLLMNTSEEKPHRQDICLITEQGFGLSSLNFPWIYKIWQNQTEGTIYFEFDKVGEEVVEFDLMLTEDLLTICKEIKLGE